jgi:hypothetical protein
LGLMRAMGIINEFCCRGEGVGRAKRSEGRSRRKSRAWGFQLNDWTRQEAAYRVRRVLFFSISRTAVIKGLIAPGVWNGGRRGHPGLRCVVSNEARARTCLAGSADGGTRGPIEQEGAFCSDAGCFFRST